MGSRPPPLFLLLAIAIVLQCPPSVEGGPHHTPPWRGSKYFAGPNKLSLCVAGTFASWEGGVGVCKVCPAGSFCPGGLVKASLCPSYTTSLRGAVALLDCKGAGELCQGSDNSTTRACFAGTFTSTAGGVDVCEPCSVGSFCPGGVTAANSCPADTTSLSSAVSITDCQCLEGFAGNDGVP